MSSKFPERMALSRISHDSNIKEACINDKVEKHINVDTAGTIQLHVQFIGAGGNQDGTGHRKHTFPRKTTAATTQQKKNP